MKTNTVTHPGEGFPVRRLTAGAVSANLTNIASIDFDDPFTSLLSIACEAVAGAPVRAVAMRIET